MEHIKSPFYADPHDDKIAGTVVLRLDTVVAAYTLPKYRTRTMIMTEHGLKFCLKGRPEDFLGASASKDAEDLLCEVAGKPV